jgi:hypothetical protein
MWLFRSVTTDANTGMKNLSSNIFRILKSVHLLPRFFLLFLFVISLCSCGYTNPYVQKSSQETNPKTLLITTWQNRTSELGLESIYFRLFNAWFKKSANINVVFEEDEADLKLVGEISSIDLPGLFYDFFDEALEIKIKFMNLFSLSLQEKEHSIIKRELYSVLVTKSVSLFI